MLNRFRDCPKTILILILALGTTISAPALAVTYTISVDAPFVSGRPFGETIQGESPVTLSRELVGAHRWYATGATEAGNLSARVEAWSNGDGVERWEAATADNTLLLNDLIFSSPNNDPIDVTLHAHLSGSISRDVDGLRETCVNSVEVWAGLYSASAYGKYSVSETINGAGDYIYDEDATYALSGMAGNTINTTIHVYATGVPVNTPVGLKLRLATKAIASRYTCRAVTDFANTFGFPTTGPVFDLPAGVTANSAKGNIVDNTFGGSPVATEATTWSHVKGLFR